MILPPLEYKSHVTHAPHTGHAACHRVPLGGTAARQNEDKVRFCGGKTGIRRFLRVGGWPNGPFLWGFRGGWMLIAGCG